MAGRKLRRDADGFLNGSSSDDTLTLQGSPVNVIDLGDGNGTLNFNANV